jgi:hypothetical protein
MNPARLPFWHFYFYTLAGSWQLCNYADHGFCTPQNSNRNSRITGRAILAIKPNSTEPEIVGAFVALTTFASSTRPLWRPDKNHFALIDDAILTEFAKQIDPGNKTPSMHSAVTSNHQPCGWWDLKIYR